MTEHDWTLIAYAVPIFFVAQAVIYVGLYRPKIRKLKEAQTKSDEAWKDIITELQRQVFGQD